MARNSTSQAIRRDKSPYQEGSVGAGGEHVGGGRHEPCRWRSARAAILVWQALFQGEVRYCNKRYVAAGRIRILRSNAADTCEVQHKLFSDPKDFLEPDKQVSAQHLLVARDRWHTCLESLSPF